MKNYQKNEPIQRTCFIKYYYSYRLFLSLTSYGFLCLNFWLREGNCFLFFFKLGFDFIFSYISIPTLKELNINFKFKKIIKWKIKGALNLVSAKKLSSGLKKLISILKKKKNL